MFRQRMLVTLFSLFAILVGHSHRTDAQEIPMLVIDGQNYETVTAQVTTPLRQDLCDRYRQVHNGTLELKNAIRDLPIVPIINAGVDQFFRLNAGTGAIDADFPGVLGLLADEFCRRAGCTWRNSFVVTTNIGADFDWDQHLFWSIDNFDVAFDWYSLLMSRLHKGAAFPEPWYEGSEVMIVKNSGGLLSTGEANISGWAKPFGRDLWLLIIFSILVSGIVYWSMVRLGKTGGANASTMDPHDEELVTLVGATTASAFNFTSHTHLPAKKTHIQLFAFSLSFLALVVITSYTANLTSYLVVDKKPHRYNSIEEAVRSGARLCVWSGTASETRLNSMFPTASFVPRSDEKSSLQSLHDDTCDVAIVSISSWISYQRQSEVNGKCDLEWVGRPVVRTPAGVVVQADSGILCTSLLGDVLTVHLREMIADGTVEKAWEAQVAFTADLNCDAVATERNGEEDRLSADGLAGIFILHGAVTVGALLYALYAKYGPSRGTRSAPIASTSNNTKQEDVSASVPEPTTRTEDDVWDEIREQREEIRQQREELAGVARQLEVLTVLLKGKNKSKSSSSSSSKKSTVGGAPKSPKPKKQSKSTNNNNSMV